MNRQQRRAAKKRKVGAVVLTDSFRGANGLYYWFEPPANWSRLDGLPDVEIHGPFSTEVELFAHQEHTLFGPDCKITVAAHGALRA